MKRGYYLGWVACEAASRDQNSDGSHSGSMATRSDNDAVRSILSRYDLSVSFLCERAAKASHPPQISIQSAINQTGNAT